MHTMRQIANYRIIKLLSRGGFGDVHLARPIGERRRVAIKVLRLPEDDNLDRFYREAKLLHRQMDNRFIVDLLDWDLEHEPPFLAMEYCDGGSLRAWVEERRDWREVVVALIHAASGLQGIHQRGGFHRDLKPDNLLLATTPDGNKIIKIGDFGLARIPLPGGSRMTLSACGTKGYMAPEVQAGASYSRKADIFSLGITGLEFLTGSTNAAYWQSVPGPPELRRLLQSMVNVNPTRRPSIDQVRARLLALQQEIMQRSRTAATVPVKQPETRKSTGSGWGGMLLGGLGLAAAALGVAAVAKSSRKRSWDPTVQRYRGPDGRFRKG